MVSFSRLVAFVISLSSIGSWAVANEMEPTSPQGQSLVSESLAPTCGVVSRGLSGEFKIRDIGFNEMIVVVPEDGATFNTLSFVSRKRSLVCIYAPWTDGKISLRSVAFLKISESTELCGQVVMGKTDSETDEKHLELKVIGDQNFIPLAPQDGATINILTDAAETGKDLCIIADFEGDSLHVEVKSAAYIRFTSASH